MEEIMKVPINLLQTHKVNIRRESSKGTYVNGYYKPSPLDLFDDIISSVQPTTGRDLEKIPEYAREKESFRFFFEKFIVERRDVVTHKSKDYEILHTEDWDGFNLNTDHYFAIGVLVDEKEEV